MSVTIVIGLYILMYRVNELLIVHGINSHNLPVRTLSER